MTRQGGAPLKNRGLIVAARALRCAIGPVQNPHLPQGEQKNKKE